MELVWLLMARSVLKGNKSYLPVFIANADHATADVLI